MSNQITIKEVLDNKTSLKKRYVKNLKQLKKIVDLLKKSNYRIVLTHGTWDLLHIGHATYLEKAKSYGDILIVGVESDKLTKKMKGANRPIVPEQERVHTILHLRSVDMVVLQKNISDLLLIPRIIRPDVQVISKTTKSIKKEDIKKIAKNCKKLVYLEPQATTSTTARIRMLMIDGARKLTEEIDKLTKKFIENI